MHPLTDLVVFLCGGIIGLFECVDEFFVEGNIFVVEEIIHIHPTLVRSDGPDGYHNRRAWVKFYHDVRVEHKPHNLSQEIPRTRQAGFIKEVLICLVFRVIAFDLFQGAIVERLGVEPSQTPGVHEPFQPWVEGVNMVILSIGLHECLPVEVVIHKLFAMEYEILSVGFETIEHGFLQALYLSEQETAAIQELDPVEAVTTARFFEMGSTEKASI